MVLKFESFGNVRKTLGSVAIRTGNHAVNVCKCLGVSDLRTPMSIDNMFKAIDDFVREAYYWNCASYELRYHKDCVPTDEEWNCICNMGKIVSKAQLFKTLSCIDYNSDIRDYMGDDEYWRCHWREDFENWRVKLNNLIRAVAESIAWERCDEEGCEWG